MISYLEGRVLKRDDKSIILLVNGVGYRIFLGKNLLSSIKQGENLNIFTFLRFREDALSLFGFSKKEELDFFELLISVSGVGPKSALILLDSLGLEKTQEAILNKKVFILTKVPGLGKKTAEKIIVELKNKVGGDLSESSLVEDESFNNEELINALQGLGYNRKDINGVLQILPKEIQDIDLKIKEALKILGKNKF